MTTYAHLALAADVLDDLERTRTATTNRLRAMTTHPAEADLDPDLRHSLGLPDDDPDVIRVAALLDSLAALEADAGKNLARLLRSHPLGQWIKAQKGVGDKQAARLLAAVGDPYINGSTGQPRTVSALWAYCGLHVLPTGHSGSDTQRCSAGGGTTAPGGDLSHDDVATQTRDAQVAARRTKGQKANWSTNAKTRAWLIIESCMKQLDPACKTDDGVHHYDDCGCSPYRVILDDRRDRTAITHPDWTPMHSLRDGQRIASKALLRDLWRESRRLHTEEGETCAETLAPRHAA